MTTDDSLSNISFVSENDLKDYFLSVLAGVGYVVIAEERTGLKGRHKRWAREDAEYAARADEAKDQFNGVIVGEMIRRGIEGVARKKFHKDDPIIDPETGCQYVEHEYSDRLLLALASSRMKEFRTSTQEIEHSGGVGVELSGKLAVGVRVLESDDWYGAKNAAAATHRDAPASNGASTEAGSLTVPVQGDCVRPTVGQDGNWIDDDTEGPRLIPGPAAGSD